METTNDIALISWMADNLNALSDSSQMSEAEIEISGVKVPIKLNLSDRHIQNLLKNSVTYKAFKSFMSWETCDTKESISNIFAIHIYSGKTVYLLQPGSEPIAEPHYLGYGYFGGKSIYAWLAEMNLPFSRDYSEEQKVAAGKQLMHGSFFENTESGHKWMYREAFEPINSISLFPDIELLTEQGIMSSDHYTQDYMNTIERKFLSFYPITYPLKFSYNKNAAYEDFPASDVCRNRGIVYSSTDRYVNQAECWDIAEEFDPIEVLNGDRYFIRDIVSPRVYFDIQREIKFIDKEISSLQFASSDIRDNRNAVLEAVKKDGEALQFASNNLKNDRYVVYEAIKNNNKALLYASDRLKNDKDLVCFAILSGPYNVFSFTSIIDIYEDDEMIASLAIKKNGYSFKTISRRLQENREFVLAHTKYFRDILLYINDELLMDKEIVLEAVKYHFWAYEDIPDELLKDRDIILAAVRNDGSVLMFNNIWARNDREIVYEAVKNNVEGFIYASTELQMELQQIVHNSGNNWREILDQILSDGLSTSASIEE